MSRSAGSARIPVVDLFAGPGGLGEGFTSFRRSNRQHVFRVALSVEKDIHAHRTLRLRSFFRQFVPGRVPQTYYEHLQGKISEEELFHSQPEAALAADNEAWLAELGSPEIEVAPRVARAIEGHAAWVLIGGPPCQAYSVAGRSRNKGVPGYRIEKDIRSKLYEEYLRIVATHEPPVFVMENVKGILSATVQNARIFERMRDDLSHPGKSIGSRNGRRYRLLSFADPDERLLFGQGLGQFVVQMEEHGVPQTRHRVIILGIREDLGDIVPKPLPRAEHVPARDILIGLPALRSGLSKMKDGPIEWEKVIRRIAERRWLNEFGSGASAAKVRELIRRTAVSIKVPPHDRGGEFVPGSVDIAYEREWFLDERIGGACNHSTREHMPRDLNRYLFASCYAKVINWSPRLSEFPRSLLPNHRNVDHALNGGFFNDRFRVQLESRPATTVTCHIHKDGHYYIHPDPNQCRSLTVREAARLQTFPDNYFFEGTRTRQYVQVGNAVPPLLARQIAENVFGLLVRAGMAH